LKDFGMTKNTHPAIVADGESHFISVGVNRVHYVTVGNGNHAIVFVHGWSCNLGFWREQIAALADQARLILIDLPGHGRSDKPHTDYTMDFFAEAVLAVLHDAKVGKAIFIGHSMGGAVIAKIHHHAPGKFAAIVSVDGLLCRLSGTPEEGRTLVGGFASPHYRQHAAEFISTFFPVPGTEALRDHVTAEMLATPQHVMLGGMLAMLDPDQPDWILPKVSVPVMIINAPSPWWSNGYEKYARSLSPQSDYSLLDGAGHFLMLEKPAEFNTLLLQKLGKFDLIGK
jgi:pimeloyl-ACP methyl ester carboxylesterase